MGVDHIPRTRNSIVDYDESFYKRSDKSFYVQQGLQFYVTPLPLVHYLPLKYLQPTYLPTYHQPPET